ncbi:DNA-directed RNA polymerase sigma-70 factor [Sporosarcina sp. NCCP-2716]|uniref:RNA polymerase sigma factor n=1 Tax=Sporosarcina sp. NCCP-2716 TaxID=2943679 RepID=UPI00204237E9|nr:sigma-70 family RNA polymerase sigma factor [Sporosarcina sp. NCCP-2716]GKV70034.1 DNA-directed RNA polymerase sigma-70 factor [Sporosarcina sp. NCCP-2716]
MNHTDDGTLYGLASSKDRRAFELLYDRYEKLVFSFAYRIASDREIAEEVVQDVFVKIWNGSAVYEPGKGAFSSWLLTVTRNKAIDELRRLQRHDHEPMVEKDALLEQPGSVEQTAAWHEQQAEIRSAVLELNPEQREIIELFYFRGLSQQKIADHCELPLGTVKGRIRLALQKLRGTITKEGGTSYE